LPQTRSLWRVGAHPAERLRLVIKLIIMPRDFRPHHRSADGYTVHFFALTVESVHFFAVTLEIFAVVAG
jgi:hypothetical protein